MKAVERVEDTARWVAMARAFESERKDALFKDPLARRLAGPSGESLVLNLSGRAGTWPLVARTVVVDELISAAIADGADAVLDLAAGLDTRPYRLAMPESFTWIEVDLADIIDTKHVELRNEPAKCHLERIALDLSDREARRALFEDVRRRFQRVVVLTEGLLYYLPESAVVELTMDLLAMKPHRWIADFHNPAVVTYLAKRNGNSLRGTAKMQFATDDGPRIFEDLGWRALETISLLKKARQLKRLPFPMSLFARLPEKPYGTPGRPWTGVCVLEPRQ